MIVALVAFLVLLYVVIRRAVAGGMVDAERRRRDHERLAQFEQDLRDGKIDAPPSESR